jgi:hypothetical protein
MDPDVLDLDFAIGTGPWRWGQERVSQCLLVKAISRITV